MKKYRFVVDCADKASCRKIRKLMQEAGFERVVDAKNTGVGDHSGIKQFRSIKAAKEEAFSIINGNKGLVYNIGIRPRAK